MAIPNGRWIVTVHLVDWAAEPGSVDTDGEPGPDALADFVVVLEPERSVPSPYSRRLVTFDPLIDRSLPGHASEVLPK